jgi:hypothetical protein
MSFSRKVMEIEIIMLSKISQIKKDKYYMFCFMCRIYSLKMSDRSIKQILLVGVPAGGGGRKMRMEVSMVEVLYIHYENRTTKPAGIVLNWRDFSP